MGQPRWLTCEAVAAAETGRALHQFEAGEEQVGLLVRGETEGDHPRVSGVVLVQDELVLGVTGEQRMDDVEDLRLLEEELRHLETGLHMLVHPECEGSEAPLHQVAVEW